MYRLFLAVIFTFSVIQLTNSAAVNSYQTELHQGTCRGDKLVDEDVIKTASPYTTKKLMYTWKGNDVYFITCINIDNRISGSETATVRVLDGGVGQSRAILEMLSKNGRGIYFHLEIYGELRLPTNNQYRN